MQPLPEDRAARPPVSVLICSKGRRAALEQVVARVADQDYTGPVEIVVVEETDRPVPIAGTRYVPIPVRDLGVAFARNLAINEASHDLIAFIDDDSPPHPAWLGKLLAPFADSRIRGVAGGVGLGRSGPIGRAEHILGFPGGGLKYRHRSRGRSHETLLVSTLNAGFRRSAVLDAGGFPKGALFAGEDQLLAARVCEGGHCVYVPDALVVHPPRGSFRAVCRWFFNRGRSSAVLVDRLGWWHVCRMLLAPKLVLAGLAGAIVAGGVGVLAGPVVWIGLSGIRILWEHRFALEYADMGVAGWLATVPVRFVMDLGFDAGVYYQCATRKART